jgi:hypothetical protein
MSQLIVVYDSSTKRLKRSGVSIGSLPSFSDNDFDVSVSGTVDFTVTSGTITESNVIDVSRNGVLCREGASFDYTRNTSLNKIVFTQAPAINSWIRVRVYS